MVPRQTRHTPIGVSGCLVSHAEQKEHPRRLNKRLMDCRITATTASVKHRNERNIMNTLSEVQNNLVKIIKCEDDNLSRYESALTRLFRGELPRAAQTALSTARYARETRAAW